MSDRARRARLDDLLQSEARLLVPFSGGVDSSALLVAADSAPLPAGDCRVAAGHSVRRTGFPSAAPA